MSEISKGGRGKQAPYTTTHARIPEAIKPVVTELCDAFREYIDQGSTPEEAAKLVTEKISLQGKSDNLSDLENTNYHTIKAVNDFKLREAITLLEQATHLKANTGGAIKVKIREAIELLK